MNETLQTIFQRHSTRAFQKKQVADDVLEQILKAGVAAPSANNSQNWIFTAVQKPELLLSLIHISSKLQTEKPEQVKGQTTGKKEESVKAAPEVKKEPETPEQSRKGKQEPTSKK